MSQARLTQLKLANFRVVYQTRGKKWRVAKRTPSSITVPKSARVYKLEFKPAKRWLKVKTVKKGKRKTKVHIGAKRALKMLMAPDKVKRKFSTVYEAITKALDGAPWQLRPRAQRQLPQWEKGDIYFNDERDLKAKWKQMAIWYAIEAEGFSDGSAVADEKVFYVDATYLEVPAEKLRGSMVTGFQDLIETRIIGEDGEVDAHNKNKDRKFDWKKSYTLLGVEGVNFEISRAGRIYRKKPGSRARRKISKA